MRATLEFDLPEEDREHMLAVQGPDLAALICEVNKILRKITKYNHEGYSEEILLVVEKIRQGFYEELEYRNLLWVLD